MRFITAFIWSFCLVALLNYVVGSIANITSTMNEFLTSSLTMSVVLAILVIILGEVIPNEEVSDN